MVNVNGVGRILYGGVEYRLSAEGINRCHAIGRCIGDIEALAVVPNLRLLDLTYMGWSVV